MKERILEKLQQNFSGSIRQVEDCTGDLLITLTTESIVAVAQFMRDDPELQFDSLRDIVGIDQYRPEERFEVIYNLYSLKSNTRLFLKVSTEESNPVLPTVSHVWAAADWLEREAYDMLGIRFEGHPDLRRIYMPEEFEHHPLRKEFPLMGLPGSLPLPRK